MATTTDDTPSNRDNLSSVSTILGLALFCLLIATIFLRRVMVHRATRRYARQRLLAAATVIAGGGGGGGTRRGEDSLDDDEPRTIAIGARAALMKRPMLWEQHLSSPCNPLLSEKRMEGAGNPCWDHIQPTALQLLTPHTTAHFPKSPPNHTLPSRRSLDPPPRRLSRAYERFLFHRDHSAPAPSVAPLQIHTALSSNPNALLPPTTNVSESAPPPPLDLRRASESTSDPNRPTSLRSQRISRTVDGREEERIQSTAEQRNLGEAPSTSPEETPQEKSQEKRTLSKDGVYAHPVHLTFLITMPDPTTPTTPASQSPFHININSPNLPPLSLGTTTHPTARLPSLLINQDDLDSWWDLPASPNPANARRIPNAPNLGRSLTSTAGRTPNFEFANGNAARVGHANANASANVNAGGNLSAGQILQLEIAHVAAEREREREREEERVLSEGVGGRGAGAARGRGNVYAGYSGLVRAAGVRRM